MKRPCADFEEKREPRGGRHSKEDLPYKPQSEKAVRQKYWRASRGNSLGLLTASVPLWSIFQIRLAKA